MLDFRLLSIHFLNRLLLASDFVLVAKNWQMSPEKGEALLRRAGGVPGRKTAKEDEHLSIINDKQTNPHRCRWNAGEGAEPEGRREGEVCEALARSLPLNSTRSTWLSNVLSCCLRSDIPAVLVLVTPLLLLSHKCARLCPLPRLRVANIAMDDLPRRWVLKPLSPPLQQCDLRSMTGPSGGEDRLSHAGDPMVRARQVRVSQDGDDSGDDHERPPDSPGGSSGSLCGFYSFVEDPTSPEAGLNEEWMASPQRQLHLATLKEDQAFKVQTYTSGKKPESLFPDSESQYQVPAESHCQVFGEEEEKQLRKEIIQKQAPKKNSTSAPSVPEKLDWSPSTGTLSKGFSLSYSAVRLEPPCPIGPGPIDRARIDFGAARQQFLKLEQGKRNVLEMEEEVAARSQSGKVQTSTQVERRSSPSGRRSEPDRLAAGDLSAEADVFVDRIVKGKSDLHDETPIEKEIRLVQERQEKLRHARGLKHADGLADMVEIQSRRVHSPLIPHKAKDKNHVSFIIQPEKHEGNVGRWVPEPAEALLDTNKPFQEDLHDQEVFLSPCCPHRHADETSSSSSPSPSPHLQHVPSWTRSLSWRANQESSGLQSRKSSGPDFIEKEIEEALRRERELQEARRSRPESLASRPPRESSGSGGDFSLVSASKVTIKEFYHNRVSGLTGALLRDFEERRERLKMDESSYAGIQPIDDINNEVVESTRVICHKSQRALRWEAGLFANQLHQ
ncbi:mitotic interactor and substrate of PLK1 [Festucalex cinctus]